MPVTLPTTDDLRRIRENAIKRAEKRAEAMRTPLLAALGAGEYVVSTVAKAVKDARTRTVARRETVQQRVAGLPTDFDELRSRAEELRKSMGEWSEGVRALAGHTYVDFAQRGAQAYQRIRQQPRIRRVIDAVESYTERLDDRVDDLVDDARDAAEKALAAVSAQTRSTGERLARVTQQFSWRAASTVSSTSAEAAEAVSRTGAETAQRITEAGSGAASTTRSTTRKAANRTAPSRRSSTTGSGAKTRSSSRSSTTRRSSR